MKPTKNSDTLPDRQFPSTSHTATMPPSEDRPVQSFDLLFEQFRQRAEAKTLLMDEVLQRSESTQRRFWGINE